MRWLLIGGLAESRLLGSLLCGATAAHLPTYIAAPVVIFAVGALAGWILARRAARVAPVEALRSD